MWVWQLCVEMLKHRYTRLREVVMCTFALPHCCRETFKNFKQCKDFNSVLLLSVYHGIWWKYFPLLSEARIVIPIVIFYFRYHQISMCVIVSNDFSNFNKCVYKMRALLAASHEPAGDPNRSPMMPSVFEHKALYILIHGPYTHIVVFWHISNIPRRIS